MAMRILVGCEESQIYTKAFCALGHDAYSCDIQGTRGDSTRHITGDVFKAIKLRGPWDMGVFFPPCTRVAVSGARWFKYYIAEQRLALEFMRDLLEAPIERIAMENPISVFSSYWRKPDQIVQPWMFGHQETKATCWWLKNLPLLTPTNVVGPPVTPGEKRDFAKVHRMPPGPNRARDRSTAYPGMAAAAALQWAGRA